MHPQIDLQMSSAIDKWTPPQNGRVPIDWVRLPSEDTQQCYRIPVWISKKAMDRCVHGLLPIHRAKDAREEAHRYRQILFGVALFGKFAFAQAPRDRPEESRERLCLWSPGALIGEHNDARHEYQVALSITLTELFNKDRVLVICLWEEQHDSVPVLHPPREQRVA